MYVLWEINWAKNRRRDIYFAKCLLVCKHEPLFPFWQLPHSRKESLLLQLGAILLVTASLGPMLEIYTLK